MKRQIPNIFTLLNLVAGCIAIVMVLQNGITVQDSSEGGQLIDIPEKIWMASFFIGIAAVVDFFDGFIARLLKVTSQMGRELDSLADVVSFGVAPSMILYQFLRLSFAGDVDGINVSMIWLLPAFMPAAAAAYRLARFNLFGSQSKWFKGLPTPAAGLLIASFPLIYWNHSSSFLVEVLTSKIFLYTFILFISWIMVSKLPVISMKFSAESPDNVARYALIAASLIAVFFLQWIAVPVIFVCYLLISLVFKKYAN